MTELTGGERYNEVMVMMEAMNPTQRLALAATLMAQMPRANIGNKIGFAKIIKLICERTINESESAVRKFAAMPDPVSKKV